MPHISLFCAKKDDYNLTIFTKLRKFHGIFQLCTKFKKCQKAKAIALLFLQNSESFPEFCNFAPNSKSAKRQGYSLTIFTKFRNFHGIFNFEPNSKSAKRQGYSLTILTKLRKFHGIFQFCTKFQKCQNARL